MRRFAGPWKNSSRAGQTPTTSAANREQRLVNPCRKCRATGCDIHEWPSAAHRGPSDVGSQPALKMLGTFLPPRGVAAASAPPTPTQTPLPVSKLIRGSPYRGQLVPSCSRTPGLRAHSRPRCGPPRAGIGGRQRPIHPFFGSGIKTDHECRPSLAAHVATRSGKRAAARSRNQRQVGRVCLPACFPSS